MVRHDAYLGTRTRGVLDNVCVGHTLEPTSYRLWQDKAADRLHMMEMHPGPDERVPRNIHFAMTPDLRYWLENGCRYDDNREARRFRHAYHIQ